MFNLIYFLFNLNVTELLNYCFVKEVMAEYFLTIKLTFGEDHVSFHSLFQSSMQMKKWRP